MRAFKIAIPTVLLLSLAWGASAIEGEAVSEASTSQTEKEETTMIERANVITFKGGPLTLVGKEIKKGDKAPAFTLTANDLSDLKSDQYAGKVLVLSVVPSLDTPVCANQTRKFNEEAAKISSDAIILTVSMDLPFAQARFCGAAGIDRVVTASDYKHREFGPAYGVLIKELGLLGRAIFVVNKSGEVTHVEYVKEVTTEPNYDAALEAVKAALK
jgi:thiol peroxidase